MIKNRFKTRAEEILKLADVKINGNRTWDIKVKNEALYDLVFARGSLGLGEAYMNDWWECESLDQFFDRILRAKLDTKLKNLVTLLSVVKAKLINLQSRSRSFEVGEKHYDLGNDFYKMMLDKRMVYSCGYWRKAKDLEQAQKDKLELICRKIGLKRGMKVLDIGCGWGSFAKYAAEKYKVKVVGITISKEQVRFGRELCKGMPVEIRLQDYRNVKGEFDRVVSVGMFEHVGYKNYREFMKIVNRCLKDKGIFLLHTIGGNTTVNSMDLWIDKYIFPNAMLPSIEQISEATQGLFVMEDWHNFDSDYDKTLMAWHSNFKRNWNKLKDRYDERFYRMWSYYLLSCAGTFRSRKNQLWQIVFSKGKLDKYESVR